jgi:hypothetical protein
MVFSPSQIFQVFFSELVKECDDPLLSIIGISPLQWLKGLISIDQCQISINAIPEIRPMGITLGRGEDDML